MMTMTKHSTARHVGMLLAAFTLLTASSCDGGTVIEKVEDWGGGPTSPYVPDGYELTFEDDFERQGPSAPSHVRLTGTDNDALAASSESERPPAWETHFATWNVRFLDGNNDQALKADAAYRGKGGNSLGEHGVILHEITGDGTLKLYGWPTPPELQDQFEMPYLGGMLSGENLYTQTYGYWEVRFRLNSLSPGHHWAFWLLPDDDTWPPEIDMLEAVGSNPSNQSDADYFFFNSILTDRNNDEITRVVPPKGQNAWYTIGFLWTETDMRWFLDGQEVRHRPAMGGDKAFYFLVSPEVGGHWVGAPTSETEWPTEAEIDYIRVYRKS